MQDIEGLALNTIVLIGESIQDSSNRIISWGKTYSGASESPSNFNQQYTEGQYRALYLRIRRIMMSDEFGFGKVFNIGDDEDLIIIENKLSDRILLVGVLLRTEKYKFTETLIDIINNVADRAGIYTAKKLHSEIFEALDRYRNDTSVDSELEKFSPIEALIYLETKDLSNTSKDMLAILIKSLVDDNTTVDRKYLHSKQVFEAVLLMLSKIVEGDDPDVVLDAAYLIASAYKEALRFYYASKTFEKIALHANNFDRLALEISCRIQIADIIKIQEDSDPSEIINTLIDIDDGSLEISSAFDREIYYCLHGYAYDKMDDSQSAEDYYLMATMVAEMEGPNTIYIAEAHAYIALMHMSRYEVDNAIREYITASSIAHANRQNDLAKSYEHQAGLSELLWSDMLAASALVLKIEGNSIISEYHAWKSLKHLIKGIGYTNRNLRYDILSKYYLKIVTMCEEVITQKFDEYTISTIDELKSNYTILRDGSLSEIQEEELLKFLLAKISVKLPLPNPVIMIIATDGRLITGGEVGSDDWGVTAFGEKDELFSGALSAIMAILSEVIRSTNPLRMVDAGSTSIMIETSSNCIAALLIEKEDAVLRRALKDVLMKIEIKYPELKEWDGYSIDFSSMKTLINNRFAEAMSELDRIS